MLVVGLNAATILKPAFALLFKAVIGSIAAAKNNGQQYSPEGFMRDFYTMIFNASGDRDNALDYVQHMPRMIASAVGSFFFRLPLGNLLGIICARAI